MKVVVEYKDIVIISGLITKLIKEIEFIAMLEHENSINFYRKSMQREKSIDVITIEKSEIENIKFVDFSTQKI